MDRSPPPPSSPIVPALRWSAEDGYDLRSPRITAAIERGVPGFIAFGGTADAIRGAVEELTHRVGRPLLMGADLERGAGQQFSGATPLPPLAALASLGDVEVLRRSGELTGREALALGIPWVFAPVADLAVDPRNPIVGTRSPGSDPVQVRESVVAWIAGCLAAGALPCVKHFPGHGRTTADSHVELPVVHAPGGLLEATDLVPFAGAIASGVPSVMTAHVAYPALDPSGRPATRSADIVTGLLRSRMGFQGLVVSDAMIMEGAGEARVAAREALAAGVDLLLYPPDDLVVGELAGPALSRVRSLMDRVPPLESNPVWGRTEDRDWALSIAERCLRWISSGSDALPPAEGDGLGTNPGEHGLHITVVDDDLGGPYPPPARTHLPASLAANGVSVTERGLPLLALYADPRAWKGRAGLSAASLESVRRWDARAPAGAPVVLFGGPVTVGDLPPGRPVLLAWGGEPLMQEAAARVLAGAGGGAGGHGPQSGSGDRGAGAEASA